MRQFFIIYFFLVVLALSVLGFRGCKSEKPPLEVFPDMDRQSKFHPQGETGFFADNRMDREAPAGAVPFITDEQEQYSHLKPANHFRENEYIANGKMSDGNFGDSIPVELTQDNMRRGQELYNIFCAICHGQSGDGNGVIKSSRYGYPTIISVVQTRIIEQPDGEIFNTITHGKNTMGPYGAKIRPEDRWKVVMYVRALQRAATATIDDVPPENRGELGL